MMKERGITVKKDENNILDGKTIAVSGGKNPLYTHQYKFLSKRRQLRVWVEEEKYNLFREKVRKNGTSVYRLINEFVDWYIENGRSL